MTLSSGKDDYACHARLGSAPQVDGFEARRGCTFHAHLMGEFKTSILPAILVSACGYALPFAELVTGVLLLAGALTRAAAMAGGLVMIVLVFGATSIEHFSVIGEQLVHTIFLAAVVAFRSHNKYSIDRLLAGRRSLSVYAGDQQPPAGA
jgi:thiosulfate dehydrogenase [quinone] large subunit